MKNIIALFLVLISLTSIAQNEKKWTLNEIIESVENPEGFMEHLVIDKDYYENESDYYERNNISLFINGEQAVYIYPLSTNFYFDDNNTANYKEIIEKIKKSGKRISFEEIIIRDEKLWVLKYMVNNNYLFIYKDPANNKYIEISKNKEII